MQEKLRFDYRFGGSYSNQTIYFILDQSEKMMDIIPIGLPCIFITSCLTPSILFLKHSETLLLDRSDIHWEAKQLNNYRLLKSRKDIWQFFDKKINRLRTGEDVEELIMKARTFILYNQEDIITPDKINYFQYHIPLNLDETIEATYENVHTTYIDLQNEKAIKCIFDFSVRFENPQLKPLYFKVLCYNYYGVLHDTSLTGECIPQHVAVEDFEEEKVRSFIFRTLAFVKASTMNELKIKLSVFTESFQDELDELLWMPLSDGKVLSYELAPFEEEDSL